MLVMQIIKRVAIFGSNMKEVPHFPFHSISFLYPPVAFNEPETQKLNLIWLANKMPRPFFLAETQYERSDIVHLLSP